MKETTYFGPQTKAIEISLPIKHWEKALRYIENREVNGLLITQELDDSHSYSLSFLSDIVQKEQITKLVIHAEYDDCEALYNFYQLTELSLGNSSKKKKSLALEHFPHLEKLSLTGAFAVSGVDTITLKSLSLAQIKDFPFQQLKNGIQTLYLRQVPLEFLSLQHVTTWRQIELIQEKNSTLEGLHTGRLEHLSIAFCPNLNNYDFLNQSMRLQTLELDHCRYIDTEKLTSQHSLEKLILSDCGKITSLQCLESMKKLKFFSCMGTEVLDGDLTPCLRLEYAAVDNKKNYNLKANQLPGICKKVDTN